MLTKRKFVFGDYDTATSGLWTLTGWSLSEATPRMTFVDIPGRLDGPLDFTEAGTGDIQYSSRDLIATFESSEGTRAEREERIQRMVNLLHGRRTKIWTPDDAEHFLSGRLKIQKNYNDLVHASITVSATCEPWKFDNEETIVSAELTEEPQEVTLECSRRAVFPELNVSGELTLVDRDSTYKLTAGTYILGWLHLRAGEIRVLQVSGAGSVSFSYRKAVL